MLDYNCTAYLQVNGQPRKEHHKGKWEQVVQKATRSLQEMLRAASQRRRNVIIDQVRRLFSGVVTFLHDENYKKKSKSSTLLQCIEIFNY